MTLEAKLIVGALLVFALILGVWYFHHTAYDAGEVAAVPKIQAKIDASDKKADAQAAKQTAVAQKQVDTITVAASTQATVEAKAAIVYKTKVTVATHDDPTYADQLVPAEFSGVRASRHSAIAASASASAAAAQELYAPVPAAH
jgi:hypothetical protein